MHYSVLINSHSLSQRLCFCVSVSVFISVPFMHSHFYFIVPYSNSCFVISSHFFVVYFPKCKCEVVFFVCPIFVVKRLSKCDAVLRDPQHPIISISKCIPALAKIVLKTYACTKRWSKLLYMRSDASKPWTSKAALQSACKSVDVCIKRYCWMHFMDQSVRRCKAFVDGVAVAKGKNSCKYTLIGLNSMNWSCCSFESWKSHYIWMVTGWD